MRTPLPATRFRTTFIPLLTLLQCALFFSGCVYPEVDLRERSCPCAEPYFCDASADRCVLSPASDGGQEDQESRWDSQTIIVPDMDAGSDAGSNAAVEVDAAVEADAVVDAGTDAPAPDAGPGPPPCGSWLGDMEVCDDFESGSLATFWQPAGDLEVTVGASRFGNRYLSLTAGEGLGAVFRPETLPTPSDGWTYVKFDIFLAEALPPASSVLGITSGEGVIQLETTRTGTALWVSSSRTRRVGDALPVGAWTCIQLSLQESAGGRVLVDVNEERTLEVTDQLVLERPDRLRFGVYLPRDTPRTTVLFDNAVVSSHPIPCSP